MSELAPIVLFVFRRPDHTARLLESLSRNAEISRSTLYVYCEGSRSEADQPAVDATRELVRAYTCAGTLQVIERERNLGCAASILAGIDEVLARHDRIIVLEDDLILSPQFLQYMNAALTRYSGSDRVMHVSGYAFAPDPERPVSAGMMPFIASWGWGTWARAWSFLDRELEGLPWLDRYRWRRFRFDLYGAFEYRKMIDQYIHGQIDAWDIRWYLSVFRRGGLCVYPSQSLVENRGHDGSGTHQMPALRWAGEMPISESIGVRNWPTPGLDRAMYARVIAELSGGASFWRRLRRHWAVA